LEKERAYRLIEEAAKTIFSYCRARTSSKEEAEDLAQDIMLELLGAKGSFVNDKAFYGFMWAVAGNVYKNWCKKRARLTTSEINEQITDYAAPITEALEKEEDTRLLYRELSLLSEQHRKATIHYYFDGLRVSQIAKSLNISESMVKFLLFKSRKILKEGMNMERTKGDLSFNPGRLMLTPYTPKAGGGCPIDIGQFERNLIAQNILLACYNESCTAEEISLQMGVAIPYLEKDLQELCAADILVKKGGRYETAVVIFTKSYAAEVREKTFAVQQEIAAHIEQFLDERLLDIKAVGFHTGTLDDGLLRWHITQLLIEQAVLVKYENSLNHAFTTTYAAKHKSFLVGIADYSANWGGGLTTRFNNTSGDQIRCIEFFIASINEKLDMGYFYSKASRINTILDIANGKMDGFSENDMLEVAEFIKNGWVKKDGNSLRLCIPVYTAEQYEKVLSIMDTTTDIIAEKTREMVGISTAILLQHAPASLKDAVKEISWLERHNVAMKRPAEIMRDSGVLRRVTENEHPTMYVLLK